MEAVEWILMGVAFVAGVSSLILGVVTSKRISEDRDRMRGYGGDDGR